MIVVAITDFERLDLDGHLGAYRALPARYPTARLSIQVRMPGRPADQVRRHAAALQTLGIPLFVNAHPEVARDLGAALHLGSRRPRLAEARAIVGPETAISVACHDEAEVRAAVAEGATFGIASPVFAVEGKGPPLGIEGLGKLVSAAGALPLVALGGIDELRWPRCRDAGAAGFAAIRAFLSVPS